MTPAKPRRLRWRLRDRVSFGSALVKIGRAPLDRNAGRFEQSPARGAARRQYQRGGSKGKRWDHTARPASYDKKVGLVLQGGGALGSYQGGVYEALVVSEYLPDWVAGIAIGAINAAVIAGNAPEHRVQRLRSFWEEITARTSLWHSAPDGPIVERQQWAGALTALMFGQPVFLSRANRMY